MKKLFYFWLGCMMMLLAAIIPVGVVVGVAFLCALVSMWFIVPTVLLVIPFVIWCAEGGFCAKVFEKAAELMEV